VSDEAEGVHPREALALRRSVPELVAVFQAAEDTVRASFAALQDAERDVNEAFSLGGQATIAIDLSFWGGSRDTVHANVDRAVMRMRRAAWNILIDRLNVRRVMSAGSWDRLQKDMEKPDVPAITVEHVEALLQQYATNLPALFEAKVLEAFDWLRPRAHTPGARYRTNEANARLELGPKVIAVGMVKRKLCGPGFNVDGLDEGQRLTALESIFCTLDGKGWGARTPRGHLYDALEAAAHGHGVTDYFAFKACRNGNLHLWFMRKDLLAEFNRIAGGKALRPKA
jgi:hypothetical protein